MKRISILTCVLLAIGSLSFFATAQDKPVPKTETKSADWKGGPAVVAPSAPVGRRDLTWRQRRELGLTLPNLVELAKELKAEGELDRDTPSGEAAAAIAVRLTAKTPSSFKGISAIDLDSIIAFIERLLPLILQLIDLFSQEGK